MALFLIALLAGVLTVLSPCVLPFLPVVVGGSLAGGTSIRRAATVTLSLGISVFLFTLLLKVSTVFIAVPPWFWTTFSGGLIIVIGLFMLFPKLWDMIPFAAKMNSRSSDAMSSAFNKQTFWGDILVGAALGPVFSSCSPTYFLVLATVLPVSLSVGIADILAYIVGMCVSLLLISFVGQRIMDRLNIASDPNGWLKRTIGAIFILIGILIITGFAAAIEAPLYSVFDETKIEQGLLAKQGTTLGSTGSSTPNEEGTASTSIATTYLQPDASSQVVSPPSAATLAMKNAQYHLAPELVMPDAYLNTGGKPITLAGYRERNVVLLDFWTYSCINCQRTLPYLESWYAKYKDQGLVIIGVSTPEFAFEHLVSNVAAALKQFGITYPVVLDNEYNTWNAYGNEYWPHDYVIDIDGYITDDHAGEGDYSETEKAIQAALAERAARLGIATSVTSTPLTTLPDPGLDAIQSPETYFGSNRNGYLANGTQGQSGDQTLTIPSGAIGPNALYLGGTWDFEPEYAQTVGTSDTIEYMYDAHNLYMVASAQTPTTIEVFLDGAPVGKLAGSDVNPTTSTAVIGADRLYTLVQDATPGVHTVMIKVMGAGLQAYTFTFG